jgi:hypothetical protein
MRNWRKGDGEWRLFDCLLFVACSSFRCLLVECNGVAGGLFRVSVHFCFLLLLLGWSSCVALTGWLGLFGLTMITMTGVDTAFSACYAEVTCYYES